MATLKDLARSIFDHALAECSIHHVFDRTLHTTVDANGTRLVIDGHTVATLNTLKQVRIIAAGKASAPMLDALLSHLPLPQSCDVQGILIAPSRPHNLSAAIQFFPGSHPLPNQASVAGVSAALSMLHAIKDASPQDILCIFLISGGASSMMELPLDPTISLEDAIAFHQVLVHSGASIVEINCIRKHFSAVKGGRLAVAAGSAKKISLLVSDVPPAHLDALASGPTIPDPTTIAECHDIIARYKLHEQFPASVSRFFASPDLPETPKPSQLSSQYWKLLDSDNLAKAAQTHAASLGFHTIIDNTCDDWTYDAAADHLLNRLRQLRREHPRVCLISTGEVTVKVPGSLANSTHTAIGGRNQHFALYAATQLRPADGQITILSAGSDGIDGNSTAAGAIIDEHTLNESGRTSAKQVLDEFDSSTWLSFIGATIVTGPTGHNLRDLRILLAD